MLIRDRPDGPVGLPSITRTMSHMPETRTASSDSTSAEDAPTTDASYSFGLKALMPLKYWRTAAGVVARSGMVVPQTRAPGRRTPEGFA
jgi:hypothetical protein